MSGSIREQNQAFIERRIASLALPPAVEHELREWVHEMLPQQTGYANGRCVNERYWITDNKRYTAYLRLAFTWQDGICIASDFGAHYSIE